MKTAAERWAKHCEHARGKRINGAIYSALRAYGAERFECRTLVLSNDWDYLCELERKAIVAFNTMSPNGYNISTGGEGVQGKRSDEDRKKISIAQKKRFQRIEEREKALLASAKGQAARHGLGGDAKGYVKPISDITFGKKLAHSLAIREAMARPEVAEKVLECAKRRADDPEWRKKISASKTGKRISQTQEGHANRRSGIKAAWADPVKKAARLEKLRATRARKKEQ